MIAQKIMGDSDRKPGVGFPGAPGGPDPGAGHAGANPSESKNR